MAEATTTETQLAAFARGFTEDINELGTGLGDWLEGATLTECSAERVTFALRFRNDFINRECYASTWTWHARRVGSECGLEFGEGLRVGFEGAS